MDFQPAAFIAQPLLRDGEVDLVVALQVPLEVINRVMQERSGTLRYGKNRRNLYARTK